MKVSAKGNKAKNGVDGAQAGDKFPFPVAEDFKADAAVEPDGEMRRRIEILAYSKAEHRGFGEGQALDDWLDAEREIRQAEREIRQAEREIRQAEGQPTADSGDGKTAS